MIERKNLIILLKQESVLMSLSIKQRIGLLMVMGISLIAVQGQEQ
jgi:hypothetical protein